MHFFNIWSVLWSILMFACIFGSLELIDRTIMSMKQSIIISLKFIFAILILFVFEVLRGYIFK